MSTLHINTQKTKILQSWSIFFFSFANNIFGDFMEDLEVLEYVYSNVNIHIEMLYKLIKKKQVKDEVYNLIKDNIIEYKKFLVSIKRMIVVRNKKRKFKNNILHNIASSIEANIKEENSTLLLSLKESSKIWILDVEKVENEYNIKSKTVINLLARIKRYEEKNLDKVMSMIG